MPDPAVVQRLEDIEAIKQLKARYFRLIDTKRFDELRELFLPDARIEGMGPPGPNAAQHAQSFDSAEAFINGPVMRGEDIRTAHQGLTAEIELTSPDTATGIWAMTDYLEWAATRDAARELPEGHRGLSGYGHYYDEYVRHDGTWRIARTRLERL